jgi:uncharacterized repeat protein (TIGR03803 family)
MRNVRFSILTALFTFLSLTAWAASGGRILYSFTGGNDGGDPAAQLLVDSSGNVYGTTVVGGTFGFGTVFQLKRMPGGTFQEVVLHNFSSSPDGKNPYGGVVADSAGNLYGVTAGGGNGGVCSGDGCGSVFKLTRNGSSWSESLIYSFQDGTDGFGPGGGVVIDTNGNLFGTTPDGGTSGAGVVFELSPQQGGTYNETILHNFTGGADGSTGGLGPLTFDSAGNLYGITELGGTSSAGTIFRLAAGSLQFSTIYTFKGQPDAAFPYGGVTFDQSGNLYGTTYFGGANGVGAVYKIDHTTRQESVIYSFQGGTDGDFSTTTLAFDKSGNLYGTTSMGGNPGCDCGTVFELKPSGNSWNETVLHRFGSTPDGANPYYGFVPDAAGNLYSTTAAGGAQGQGIIFAFKP